MAGFTIPRAFVSLDPWSGMLLVGMPRGVALPDGRDIGGYSLCKPATEGGTGRLGSTGERACHVG